MKREALFGSVGVLVWSGSYFVFGFFLEPRGGRGRPRVLRSRLRFCLFFFFVLIFLSAFLGLPLCPFNIVTVVASEALYPRVSRGPKR